MSENSKEPTNFKKGIKLLGNITLPFKEVNDDYFLNENDYFVDCKNGTFMIVLPDAVSNAGKIFVLKNSGNGIITVCTKDSLSSNSSDQNK